MSRGRRLGLTAGVGRRGDARCVGWCGDNGAKPASGGERRRVGLRGVRVGGPWGVQHVTSLKISRDLPNHTSPNRRIGRRAAEELRREGCAPFIIIMERAIAVAATAAAVFFASRWVQSKRRKVDTREEDQREEESVADATPVPVDATPTFSLFTELLEDDALFDVVRLMPAAAAARCLRVSKLANEKLSDPTIAKWCAASRKRMLSRRAWLVIERGVRGACEL